MQKSPAVHFLIYFTSVVLFLGLARLLFWKTYGSGSLPFAAWTMGARFDAVIGVYGAIPLLFSLLWDRVTTVARCISVFSAMIISMIVVADFSYFPSAAKRLGYEAWVYLNLELIPIALTAIRASPVFSLCAICAFFALSYVFYSFIRMPAVDLKKKQLSDLFCSRGGLSLFGSRWGSTCADSLGRRDCFDEPAHQQRSSQCTLFGSCKCTSSSHSACDGC